MVSGPVYQLYGPGSGDYEPFTKAKIEVVIIHKRRTPLSKKDGDYTKTTFITY